MKVGDLVKHTGLNDVTWLGIVTMERSDLNHSKVFVEWATGGRGWFYCSDLEAV